MRFFALVSALPFLCCAQPRSTLASAGAEEVIDTTKSAVNERPDASRPPATSNVTPLRCGWFDNPTPGNFWLVDRDGSWEVGVQGGYQAKGLDRIPDFERTGRSRMRDRTGTVARAFAPRSMSRTDGC